MRETFGHNLMVTGRSEPEGTRQMCTGKATRGKVPISGKENWWFLSGMEYELSRRKFIQAWNIRLQQNENSVTEQPSVQEITQITDVTSTVESEIFNAWKTGFWRNWFNRIALGMNVIDWKIRTRDRRWHFLEILNQRKFLYQYDQIPSKIAIKDRSLDSGLKPSIFRNSGTNIEPGRSSRAQKNRVSWKEAHWLQKRRVLTHSAADWPRFSKNDRPGHILFSGCCDALFGWPDWHIEPKKYCPSPTQDQFLPNSSRTSSWFESDEL
jgi:hypothetical protein